MNLDESQRQQVAKWIGEGLKLSDIQNKLTAEFGVRLTYMELRFLLDDLKLKPKDAEPPPAPTLAAKTPPAAAGPAAPQHPAPGAGAEDADDEKVPAGGSVSVTMDQVTRPGALVSGKVTFSDGQGAEWYLDQMGRLGVVARQQGYKPSQADLMAFQAELQTELAKMGY
jgi:hypothetical protein